MVSKDGKDEKSKVADYRTVTIYEDGLNAEETEFKKMVVTKFMDLELFTKKVMEKLKMSKVNKVMITPEDSEEEFDMNGDLNIIPDQGTLRIIGESYLGKLRELQRYEEEGKRIAEEKRLDLKKRVAKHKAMKLGLPDPYPDLPDENLQYEYDSDGPEESEFKGLTVPITFQPGPGGKLNAVVVGWSAPGYAKAYPSVSPGDFIITINEIDMVGKPFEQIMQFLRESSIPRKIYFHHFIQFDVIVDKAPEDKKDILSELSDLKELKTILNDPDKIKDGTSEIDPEERKLEEERKQKEKEEEDRPTKKKGIDAAEKQGFHFSSIENNRGCKLEALFNKSVMENHSNLRPGDHLSFINNIKIVREKFDITMMEFFAASLRLPMTLTFRQVVKIEKEDDSAREDRMRRTTNTFMICVREGDSKEVGLLVNGGQDVKCVDSTSCTALHYAAAGNYIEIINILLKGGADINAADNDGKTPLHYAASRGNADVVTLLLKEGANNGVDKSGRSALHFSSIHNHLDCLKVLLKTKNTQIDAQEFNWGWTALHFVASIGSLSAIKLFVRAGAEMHIKSKLGKEIIDVAKENGKIEAIKYLEGQINLEPLHLVFTFENSINLFVGSYEGCTKDCAVKFDISAAVVIHDTGKPRVKSLDWIEVAKWLNVYQTDMMDGNGEEEWMSFVKSIPGVIKFIDAQASKPSGNILICSKRGKNRSALLAVVYMILKKNMSLKEALFQAKQRRPVIKIHDKFASGMEDIEDALQRRYLEIKRMEQYDFLTTQITPLF